MDFEGGGWLMGGQLVKHNPHIL